MGTRGLRIFFFRGRYFVYYNHYDSYPSGLGRSIVDGIPPDLEEYKEWLQRHRKYYETITAKLESQVITVTEDMMHHLVAPEEDQEQGEWCLGWRAVDSELQELPTAFCAIGNNLFIEWTYLIDLDRETFSVNNWIHFDLWNIPQDRWIQAFEDQDDGRMVFSFEVAPEGWEGLEPPDHYGAIIEKRDALKASYEQYPSHTVGVLAKFQPTAFQIVATALFEQLSRPVASIFPKTLSSWASTGFGFREVAFSILSLAAGIFYFEKPKDFCGSSDSEESNGYLVRRDEEGTLQLMPLFGSGCHIPNQDPGSAPTSSMYWFAGVLISLVPHSVFLNDTDAAVAEVLASSLVEGHQNFQGMLFSIFTAVFFEVTCIDGVCKIKRTQPVSVLKVDSADHTAQDDRSFQEVQDHVCGKHRGFIALQHFFTTAAKRRLSVSQQGIFPIEVYDKIIANADRRTREACAEVSIDFKALCQRHSSFSNNLSLVRLEKGPRLSESQALYQQNGLDLENFGTFIFHDESADSFMKSTLFTYDRFGDEDLCQKVVTWCPVIGGVGRRSMMTDLQLQFEASTPMDIAGSLSFSGGAGLEVDVEQITE